MPAEPRASRPGGWGNRDFHDEVARRPSLLQRGVTAALVTAAAFVVFLLAIQHENTNCGDACYDGGLRSYEGGHAWTAYHESWQWQAQWGLGGAGLVLGLAALTTASRYSLRRWTLALNGAAAACATAWVLWRVLEPPIPA
ncbi:MAG TPA: hypothetical protein VNT03_19320 [Baekduia sp.]|nr:hypothetical protein [Baekduia sp.]